MRHLFAQPLAVGLLPPSGEEPDLRYDHVLALNVLPDGTPFIATAGGGSTVTLTKVRSEADDYDQAAERVHPSAQRQAGTETRRVPGEQEDFDRRSFLSSMTKTEVRAEPDDEDRDARGDEGFFHFASTTSTFVRTEAEDRDRDQDLASNADLAGWPGHSESGDNTEIEREWNMDTAFAAISPAQLIP